MPFEYSLGMARERGRVGEESVNSGTIGTIMMEHVREGIIFRNQFVTM